MKSSLLAMLLLLQPIARPGYQTEWWYYTGNLRAPDGHRFGFELTFFRSATTLNRAREQAEALSEPRPQGSGSPAWNPTQLYLAHLALTDLDRPEFYYTERLNRAGPGLAGASLEQQRIWNGNWQVRWNDSDQQLQAVSDRLKLNLNLHPEKPPVINQAASHYISYTRLRANGTLDWHGTQLKLDGLAWMDHEFFNEGHDKLGGWDWFSIQLDNNEELMLYRLRHGASGTYVDAEGVAHYLKASDIRFESGDRWRSPSSGADYPLTWKISIPSLGLELTESTALRNQELFSKNPLFPTYWEGAVAYAGTIHSRPVHGVGYLEMTGYAAPLIISPTQRSTRPQHPARNAASQPATQTRSSAVRQ